MTPYETITQKVIEQLEKGVMPWKRPWDTSGLGTLPLRENGEPYKGVNSFWLGMLGIISGYESPYWMTYKSAKKHGGQVRKGEKSSLAVYYGTSLKDKENPEEGAFKFLKGYSVFNVSQIDGLPDGFYRKEGETPRLEDHMRIPHADSFFDRIGQYVTEKGDRAFYKPGSDSINMPPWSKFHSPEAYYSTLGHEHIHRTGHEKRLNRQFGRAFGDSDYAREELVAELGASFLMGHLGLASEPREDHASYIQSWLKVLKEDKKAIFGAAAKAQEATDYLIGEALQSASEAA